MTYLEFSFFSSPDLASFVHMTAKFKSIRPCSSQKFTFFTVDTKNSTTPARICAIPLHIVRCSNRPTLKLTKCSEQRQKAGPVTFDQQPSVWQSHDQDSSSEAPVVTRLKLIYFWRNFPVDYFFFLWRFLIKKQNFI